LTSAQQEQQPFKGMTEAMKPPWQAFASMLDIQVRPCQELVAPAALSGVQNVGWLLTQGWFVVCLVQCL
jgi:hypothetical protein